MRFSNPPSPTKTSWWSESFVKKSLKVMSAGSLMYGTMSGPISNPDSMKGVLKGLADNTALGTDHRRKALLLIHLISISPEFSLQR